MRSRLNILHQHVILQVIDAGHYGVKSLAECAEEEEAAILEELGLNVYPLVFCCTCVTVR